MNFIYYLLPRNNNLFNLAIYLQENDYNNVASQAANFIIVSTIPILLFLLKKRKGVAVTGSVKLNRFNVLQELSVVIVVSLM